MAATATASHSTSHLTPAPHRSPVHRFGWHDEGGALGLHLHCLHQPQEPFMGAKEVPPSPRPQGGPHDGQAGPGCAVPKPGPVQSPLCHLWAILPLFPVCSGPRVTPAITGPTQDCSWKRHLKMGSLTFLGFSFLTPSIQTSSKTH